MILHATRQFPLVDYWQFGRNYLIDRVLTAPVCASYTFTPPIGFLESEELRFSWSSNLFAAIPLQCRPRHGESFQCLRRGLHQRNANLHAATRGRYGWCWNCSRMSHGKSAVCIFYWPSPQIKLKSRRYKVEQVFPLRSN